MRHALVVCSLILLTACGWHLRGVTPLPPEYRVMYLQSQASNSFNQQLKLQLEFNDVVLTASAEDAPAILRIEPVDIERRTLSVSSSGQVGEFELNGRLTAHILHIGRDTDVEIELKARRTLTNDVNNVVGTASAETQQRAELERELVNKLLRRLQSLSKTRNSDNATDSPS
ncbi:MAG: hypothetical protein COB09_10365 [Thalassobium sp.]|jgi:LPS-assembly lipoprotein|uniref:LPS-assembly lipoprotein LptE n=1 Tax=Thalassolituus pacificus TaxID=2975440 RepID=A0A9X3AQH2_9GAMM|nr:LPS assembly lipoprotein LptE [Thalassolituus pacificus]MCT7358145.1 hypothetical protein [Thalassolituus pacificus]PHS63639.1 MAG: hypothetical protein COB09_10365 [Thalassobium sp.]